MAALAGAVLAKDVPRKPFTFDQPLHVALEPGAVASFNSANFADVNGDGRVDMVLVTGQEPYEAHRLALYLSRPGGFDGPTYIEPNDCNPIFRFMDADSDRAKEILVTCSHVTYSSADYWMQVFDIGPDGSIHAGPRSNLPEQQAAPPNILDMDQDGLDDVVFNVRWTYSAWVFRTVVYYNRGPGAWHRVEGPDFTPPGYDPTRQDPPLDYHFNGDDLDGDGARDIMWGWCPSWCMVEQEPWGQMVGAPMAGPVYLANSASFGDLDGDGAQDLSMGGQIFLQTSDRTFEPALEILGLYRPANGRIADFDRNGLADWVTVDEDYIIWLLQVTPGAFELHWLPVDIDNPQGEKDIEIADLDADGCPDAVLPRMANGFWMFRGRNCVNRSNLEVMLSTSPSAVTARVRHVSGPDVMKGQVLRVVLAPQIQDATPLGALVVPPAGCIAVALRSPRKAFDCLLPDMAPQAEVSLQFQVAYSAPVLPAVPMQATALLLETAGDIDKADNRAFTRFFVRQPASSVRSGTRRPAAKRLGVPARPASRAVH